MGDVHIFSNLADFIKEMKDFKNKNPTCYIQVKNKPRQLLNGFEAILDDESTVEWYLPLSKMREYNDQFSGADLEITKNFFKLTVELSEAQRKFVKLFTGQE